MYDRIGIITKVLGLTLITLIIFVEIGKAGDVNGQIRTIIEAANKKDVDFFFNNNLYYKIMLQNIEQNMPKFKQDQGKKQLYDDLKNNILTYTIRMSDPGIVELCMLFSFPCRWKIIETREEKRGEVRTISYIEVNYNTPQQSPRGNDMGGVSPFKPGDFNYDLFCPIKKLILCIDIDGKTGLFARADVDKTTVVNW